jgi:four helix bundle protein
MNNIAEGFERHSDAEFARFLNIAKGSAGEVRSMFYSAEDLHYVNEPVAVDRREAVKTISKGIATLEAYLRKRPSTFDFKTLD